MSALSRNTLLAIPAALLFYGALPHRGPLGWDLLDAFTLSFSFTYVGHWVEKLLLKIPGIEPSSGKMMRVLSWCGGGLWWYQLGRWALVAYGRATSSLP